MANTIGFGRRSGITGQDLSEAHWAKFRNDVEFAVQAAGGDVIFRGTGDGIWDGIAEPAGCVVFLGGDAEQDRAALAWRLASLCARYGQDAIAVTYGDSILVHAGTCHACGRPFATAVDWDVRHTDADGEDVHDACCDRCNNGAGCDV